MCLFVTGSLPPWKLIGPHPILPPWLWGVLCVKSLQSCSTLCDPMDCSPPDSSVYGVPRQEYWSGLPSPSSGDVPNPGNESTFSVPPALQAGSLPLHQALLSLLTLRAVLLLSASLCVCDALVSPWVEITCQVNNQEMQTLFPVSKLLAFRNLDFLLEPSLAWT